VNDTAYGVNGSPLTIEFIDEVNVITGGYMPEYGRTLGGALSAVTKSGGNEFHGSLFGNWRPGALAATPRSAAAAGSTGVVTASASLFNVGDLGATLGGYILKDRLWFFAGFQYAFSRYSYERTFNTARVDGSGNPVTDPQTGTPIYDPIENSLQRRFSDERYINFIAKLTYLIGPDHRVSVSVNGTPTTGGGGASLPTRLPGGLQSRGAILPSFIAGGTFNSTVAIQTKDSSYNVVGELNSSFLDKRLLLDLRAGWHHQVDEGIPSDGSGFDVTTPGTLAGTPFLALASDVLRNIADIDQVPRSVSQACSGQFAEQRCGVLAYTIGGPGFIERLVLDSFQFKGVMTFLLNAGGHHVFKAGFDGTIATYEHTKGYTGTVAYRTLNAPGAPGDHLLEDYRRLGYLSGPDTPVTAGANTIKSRSTILGGFLQDSWSILDKVTLNVGVRYDTLAISGEDKINRIVLGDQISPRIGVVWDPTQQGRAKLYANYARYYENIPLDIADRELTTVPGLVGLHRYDCDPLGRGVANCDAHTFVFFPTAPSQHWLVTAADQVPVDPELKSPSNDEVVAGAEYEVLPNARLGLSYSYRNLVRTVEDMSNDEANTYFIGNPGEGIARTFPKAKRTRHAVTASFVKSFSDLWLAQLSYTWASLRGNYDGLYRPENNQLDPNLNSTFDLKSLLLNQDGPLGADVTHTVKVYLAKEFPILPVLSITTGASFTGSSGIPILANGAHPTYGAGEAYILERGGAGRLPWVTSFDLRFAVNYRVSTDSVVTAAVDAFNVFNSQRPTSVDINYTLDTVGPIVGARQGSVPTDKGYGAVLGPNYDPSLSYQDNLARGNVVRPANGSLPRGGYVNGAPLKTLLPSPTQVPIPVTVNPNWGQPLGYQAERTVRFSLRFTF